MPGKICIIGCLVSVLAMLSVPAWSSGGADTGADDLLVLALCGHGHGATECGSESVDCPNLGTDVNDDVLIIAHGHGGRSGSKGGGTHHGRDSCGWGLTCNS